MANKRLYLSKNYEEVKLSEIIPVRLRVSVRMCILVNQFFYRMEKTGQALDDQSTI